MKDPNLSFMDIALDVGFNNRQNLYLTFKKFVGMSHLEYRANLIRSEEYILGDEYVSDKIEITEN